ncbi:MAG: NAD(P)/FAD-dependent oxidoreductase [Acidimicrobiales bacterium]
MSGRRRRIVVVGASLAGLRAAEELRRLGYEGDLVIVGDEPDRPYDRPPLSKQVQLGWAVPEHTTLPSLQVLDPVEWRLGTPAAALDHRGKEVVLADGSSLPFDQVIVATGVRNLPWPNAEQAALSGVCSVRTRSDARQLRDALDTHPSRVLVIGAGFTGSEVASVCRSRGIDVTVVERGSHPLVGALGGRIGEVAEAMQRDHGVDVRCGTTVEGLEGSAGRFRAAVLSDGTTVEATVAVVALGARRNTEWLADSGLAASALGISVDAGLRAFSVDGLVVSDVVAAGDVARFPHALFNYEFLALEHWENALVSSRVAAHNLMCEDGDLRPHVSVPIFWSVQFSTNIKSAGVPALGEEILLTQGSADRRHFAAAFLREGRVVGAVTFDHSRYLDYYRSLIEQAAHAPEPIGEALGHEAWPAGFPPPGEPYHGPTVVVTGHSPTAMTAHRR